jgi:exopolyphosphatase/guanosine-5'-triphosphate,3'-diphosphate pyrophosphatase
MNKTLPHLGFKPRYLGFDSLTEHGHYAAIDLGSNTCRLLIAKPTQTGYKVVDSFSRVVRLGVGVRSNRILGTESMDRAIDALKECAKKLKRYTIIKIRSVATEACRQAENTHSFITRVKVETGIELEIIPQFEEARLALKGCTGLIDPTIPYVLGFDIGGCSTEVMWAKVFENGTTEVLDWVSLPFGVVSILESCGGDPGLFYKDICTRIQNDLTNLSKNNKINLAIEKGQVQMIGSSGTTTTIAAMHLNLPVYDREKVDGCYLPLNTVHSIANKLREMSPRERANQPCIGPGRCELVLGGLAILEAICKMWLVKDLRVADRGVRDGILNDLITDTTFSEPFITHSNVA